MIFSLAVYKYFRGLADFRRVRCLTCCQLSAEIVRRMIRFSFTVSATAIQFFGARSPTFESHQRHAQVAAASGPSPLFRH
jgi:hypothetical protein